MIQCDYSILNYSGSRDQVLYVKLQALILLIVDLQMREFYGILKEANPHFFALFSVEFHPVTGAPRGDSVETGLDG